MNSSSDFSVRDITFYNVGQPIMNLREDSVHGYEILLRSKEFVNPNSCLNLPEIKVNRFRY